MLKILKAPLVFGCFTFLFYGSLFATPRTGETSQSRKVSSADDLPQRVKAAMEARKSGDPAAIAEAGRKVIALALVELAKLQLDKKAYDEAAKLCGESLEFENTAETRVEIAIANLYAKNPDEAVKQASSAAEMDPQNALAWTIKGEALLRSGNYPDAARAFDKALEVKREAEPLYALGIAQLGLGEKQRAAETFSQFLAQVGDAGWSRVLVGRAYEEQALFAEAVQEFQEALRRDPATSNANYFWAVTSMQANGGNPNPEVYSHLRAELQLNPRHFEANYMLGFLASTTRDDRESDRFLHLAAEIRPSEPETWVFLGLNAQKQKANRTAEAHLRKAIKLSENLDPKEHFEIRKAYFGLGRILMATGRTKEAEAVLNKARELQAQNLGKIRKTNAAIEGRSETEVAESDAPFVPGSDSDHPLSVSKENAITKDNASSRSNPEKKTEKYLETVLGASLNDLATAEALQEKYQEAFNHYREAARWDRQIPGLDRNLGLAAYFVNDYGEAIRLLKKTVNAAPHDEHARAVLGLAYFAKEDFAKAVRTIAPIAERAQQDPQLGSAWAKSLDEIGNKRGAARVHHQLGLALLKSQDVSEGVRHLEEAERLQPDENSIHVDLEAAYQKAGRTADADREHVFLETKKSGRQKTKVLELQGAVR
jgi:tetratricopeptide (TPR) repeat protein